MAIILCTLTLLTAGADGKVSRAADICSLLSFQMLDFLNILPALLKLVTCGHVSLSGSVRAGQLTKQWAGGQAVN